MHLPMLTTMPWDLITELSGPATDGEGRPYYAQADATYVAQGQSLSETQWHRTAQWGLARAPATSGAFLKDELVLLCFTETSEVVTNRAGITDASGSSFAVAVYPLRAF